MMRVLKAVDLVMSVSTTTPVLAWANFGNDVAFVTISFINNDPTNAINVTFEMTADNTAFNVDTDESDTRQIAPGKSRSIKILDTDGAGHLWLRVSANTNGPGFPSAQFRLIINVGNYV
jgi:hypothetical protein